MSCIISTNLDTMIRLIYMISILIIYMYTSYIYMWGTDYWCMNTTNTMMTGLNDIDNFIIHLMKALKMCYIMKSIKIIFIMTGNKVLISIEYFQGELFKLHFWTFLKKK